MLKDLHNSFDLSSEEMNTVWDKVGRMVDSYRDDLPGLRVALRWTKDCAVPWSVFLNE